MKKHAIIPIFIPHQGCPNDCVFCNQRKITAKEKPISPRDAEKLIIKHLGTLKKMDLDIIEVAFYGGSFTGLDIDEQSEYLAVAKKHKDKGDIDKIHLSTRPDYIDENILNNLKKYSVDIIELGVQSFDEEVLKLSNRGHNKECIYQSASLIKEYGFELGIQLMIGLPGDTMSKCIYSAKETVKLKPQIARLYPTVVIENTELYEMYKSGDYTPLSMEEAVNRTKAMYEILSDAGINIIRVGLKSSDIIMEEGSISSQTFHPAFRQLVESEIAKEKIQNKLDSLLDLQKNIQDAQIAIYANDHSLSNAVGLNGSNKGFWQEQYPSCSFSFKTDNNLKDYQYEVKLAKRK